MHALPFVLGQNILRGEYSNGVYFLKLSKSCLLGNIERFFFFCIVRYSLIYHAVKSKLRVNITCQLGDRA